MTSRSTPFTKMQGLGNDYIYFNCFQEKIENPARVARALSDRHFGIGGDGIVLIQPSSKGNIREGYLGMRMFNADGSEAEMCGNAIRCVGKYAYARGLTEKRTLKVETLAGEKELELLGSGTDVSLIRVDMGAPVLESAKIPVAVSEAEVLDLALEVRGEELRFSAVSMGNPHAVFLVDQISDRHVLELGPVIEKHPLFPKRINVEFVEVQSRSQLRMRVWERGSGETLACGTGACAAAVACMRLGKCGRSVAVELIGGTLEIIWSDAELAEKHGLTENHVYKTGPAEFVFDGSVQL